MLLELQKKAINKFFILSHKQRVTKLGNLGILLNYPLLDYHNYSLQSITFISVNNIIEEINENTLQNLIDDDKLHYFLIDIEDGKYRIQTSLELLLYDSKFLTYENVSEFFNTIRNIPDNDQEIVGYLLEDIKSSYLSNNNISDELRLWLELQ